MFKFVKSLIILLFIICCTTYHTEAQEVRSITQGVSAQVYGTLNTWRSNSFFIGDISDSDPNGRGYGIKLAYGITSSIEVFGNFGYANYNLSRDWEVLRVEHFTLGGQYYFGASRQFLRPYLSASISRNNQKVANIFIRENNVLIYNDAEMILKGVSGNFGGGLHYYPIPELAIDLGIMARFGNFGSITVNADNYEQNENVDFRFFGLKLGVSYFFF